MGYVQRINSVEAMREAMRDRCYYSDEALAVILSHREGEDDIKLDAAAVNMQYVEYDSVYELCVNLQHRGADDWIWEGLIQCNLLDGTDNCSLADCILYVLRTNPTMISKRYPEACAFWLDKLEKSSVGDVSINDCCIDFISKDWDDYIGFTEDVIDHPKYGVDSDAFEYLRSHILSVFNWDSKALLEQFIIKQRDWTHDYCGYQILKNGHVLCWK